MNRYERVKNSLDQMQTFVIETGQEEGTVSAFMALQALQAIRDELLFPYLELEGMKLRE